MTFSKNALDWLSQSTGIHPRHLEAVRLKGSTSSSIYRIQHATRADVGPFVLRVIDNHEWLSSEPDLAAHEAAALEEAYRAGLHAPRLIAYAAEDVGFGAPVVLMSFVDGTIELRPANLQDWLNGLAHELAAIHRHSALALPWRFTSWVNRATLAPPDWARHSQAWAKAIERILQPAPDSPLVFIHRDYHPTNVLFLNGAVTGVVDWINACRGPAGVDLAHCKTNLVMIMGVEVAEQFHAAYLTTAKDFIYDPYWDIDSILDMCLPEPGFYEPWLEFGLARITPEVLQQRIDQYLERVLRF